MNDQSEILFSQQVHFSSDISNTLGKIILVSSLILFSDKNDYLRTWKKAPQEDYLVFRSSQKLKKKILW